MAALKPLTRSETRDFEVIWQSIEGILGFLPNSILTMAHNPRLPLGFAALSATVWGAGDDKLRPPVHKGFGLVRQIAKALLGRDKYNALPMEVRHLVATAVSFSAGCRYCQAHSANTAARYGVSEEKIQGILDAENSPHYSEAERAAVALAFAAGQVPNQAGEDHFQRLRQSFTERQIVDIVAIIAMMGFLNRWNDTMGTALEGEALTFAEQNLAPLGWEVGKH